MRSHSLYIFLNIVYTKPSNRKKSSDLVIFFFKNYVSPNDENEDDLHCTSITNMQLMKVKNILEWPHPWAEMGRESLLESSKSVEMMFIRLKNINWCIFDEMFADKESEFYIRVALRISWDGPLRFIQRVRKWC